MEASIPRNERAFWADSIGGSSFDLDAERYTDQATVARGIVSTGDKVLVCPTVDGRGRRQMLILDSKGSSGRRRLTYTPFLSTLSDWLYALGGAGLGRSALSPLPNPAATPSTVWTGTGVFNAFPMGVLSLAAGAKILTAQLLRNTGDTAWEKLRLHVIGTGAETLDVDLLTSPAIAFGYSRMWSDAPGTLVLISLAPTLEIYRRRFGLFEALTLADNSKDTFEFMNVVSGSVVTGAYQRNLPSITGTTMISDPTITYGTDDYPTNGGYVEGWLCDVSGTSIARAWQVAPNEVLALTHPILLSWVGQMAGCNGSVLGFASGREALNPLDSTFNLGLSAAFLNPASDAVEVALTSTVFSRTLKASIFAVDPDSGAVTGQYDLDMTAAAPHVDEGLLQPMEDCLEGTMPADSGSGSPNYLYTWGGRHTQQDTSSAFSDPIGVGDNRYINYPTRDDASPSFLAPDFEVFCGDRIGIQFLPMGAKNSSMPAEVGTNFRTTDAFTGWPGNSGDSSVSQGAISCKDSSAYFAWLKPYPILFPEHEGPVFNSNGNLLLETINAIGPPGYFYGATKKFLPTVAFCQERFLTKVAVSGGGISHAWTSDLTQLVTAAWWRASVDIAPPFGWTGHEFVGGDSTDPIPLGDQIYQISAAGRVVFATLDLHALGAKFLPETRLAILDDSDGSLLHTIAINLDDSLLTADIREPDGDDIITEETENWTIDPDTSDDHALLHDLTELISITINGDPAVEGVDYTYASPNRFLINTGPLGADVSVTYTWTEPGAIGAVRFYEGERRYGTDSVELRTGSSGGLEWAICFVSQTDRTDDSGVQRTVVIETGTLLSDTPTVTQYTYFPQAPASVALANGHLLTIDYSGGSWKINQV